MALTDMRRSVEDRSTLLAQEAPREPEYPYGLGLELDEEGLKKLGLKALPKPGDKMVLKAVVTVKSAGIHEVDGQDPKRNASLQITHMALGPHEEKRDTIFVEDD